MSNTIVRKWGNSMAVRIPRHLAKKANIDIDTEVEVLAVEGHIVVRPARNILTFADLIEEADLKKDTEKRKKEKKVGVQ